MNRLFYLAYGSNLHPVRLMKRVPSASLLGQVELVDTRIVFHKRGADRSGKCMMIKDEANNFVAYGALFSIDADELMLLDRFEGRGKGYDRQVVSCRIENREYRAFTYIAATSAINPSLDPFHWYKRLVLAGARYHRFPDHYISYLEGIESIPDPDQERSTQHERLLEEIERL